MTAHWDEILRRHGITVHPAATMFPLLDDEDLRDLAADIEKSRLRNPLCIRGKYGAGELMDGRRRCKAMALLPDGETMIEAAISAANYYPGDTDPWAFVSSQNLHRRHMTLDDRKRAARRLLEAHPEWSDRYIGQLAGVHGETVKPIRETVSSTAGNRQLPEKRVGRDGKARKRPTAKPKANGGPAPDPTMTKTWADQADQVTAPAAPVAALLLAFERFLQDTTDLAATMRALEHFQNERPYPAARR